MNKILPHVKTGDIIEIIYASGVRGKLALILHSSDEYDWVKIFDFDKQIERTILPYFVYTKKDEEIVVAYKKVA